MNVLIVESAAKTRTIQKYLGSDWRVLATGGHVGTLPQDRKSHGKAAGKAYWSNRPGELPTPPWVWTERGAKAVGEILDAAGENPIFWIATDPDREGEFIAWCLERLLSPHGKTHRVTFQEITEEAVRAAIAAPREVDQKMVDSALVRKFIDRLVGYRTSKTAAAMVGRGASMGRVQTPTLGFVVEREEERMSFVPTPYFEVRATAEGVKFTVRFHEADDADVWRDATGKIDTNRTQDVALATRVFQAISTAGRIQITRVKATLRNTKPQPPFSTDALLQTAGSKFGWSPKKTSALASALYEAGHITYIRTDSTRLAVTAAAAARGVVANEYGEDHLGEETLENKAVGLSQDAHEAIRPTHFEIPDAQVEGDTDSGRLYRLIRARALASQMKPSIREGRSIEAACEGTDLPLMGSVSWRTFAGWEAAYSEFQKEVPDIPSGLDIREGVIWSVDLPSSDETNPTLIEDQTKPPGRYQAHTLIGLMKKNGIGRPSTYARTVEKLEERRYVEVVDGAIAPTEKGCTVWLKTAPLYAESDELELFSATYTSGMEEGLDQIANEGASASEKWATWRDEIRSLHEIAQIRLKSGQSTPKQQQNLLRMLKNAPENTAHPLDVTALSHEQAAAQIAALREAGIEPAPTVEQLKWISKLIEELALTAEEMVPIIPEGNVDNVRTTAIASRVIEDLKRLHEERKPPSSKQRQFIDGLLKSTATTAEEAAAMVGLDSLGALTGGQEGTASALIEALKIRKEERKAEGKTV
jgi:DNA topoisomerase I